MMARTKAEQKRLERERHKLGLKLIHGWFESKLYKQLMALIEDYKG